MLLRFSMRTISQLVVTQFASLIVIKVLILVRDADLEESICSKEKSAKFLFQLILTLVINLFLF